MSEDDVLLQVKFVGEGAIDYGGPRREFFRLLALNARDTFFIGDSNRKFFDTNVSAVQVIIMSMSVCTV